MADGGQRCAPSQPLGPLHLWATLRFEILLDLPLESSGSEIVTNSKRADTSLAGLKREQLGVTALVLPQNSYLKKRQNS